MGMISTMITTMNGGWNVKEIDGWVRQFVTDRRLRPLIKRYLKFMELWENLEAPKMLEIEEQG